MKTKNKKWWVFSGNQCNYNIIIGKRNNGLKYYFNKLSTYELINELKRICKKKDEEITYHDIEVVHVILCILKKREDTLV